MVKDIRYVPRRGYFLTYRCGVYTGSIYKVDNDGLGLIELVSYGGTPIGMDLYEFYGAIYWAGAMGYVYKSHLDGTGMGTILDDEKPDAALCRSYVN